LWIVEKFDQQGNRLMPVVPRLFHLDLTPRDRGAQPRQSDPGKQLDFDEWRITVRHLEAALLDNSSTLAFGQRDLRAPEVPLNDFLETARTQEGAWLSSVLDRLKIVME